MVSVWCQPEIALTSEVLEADVPPSRNRIRYLLALGVVLGLGTLVALPTFRPEQLGLATTVYTNAANAAVAGQSFYEVTPPGLPEYRFVYPPVVMLAALPVGIVNDATTTFWILTVLSIAAGLAVGQIIIREIELVGSTLAPVDRGLIMVFCCASSYVTPSLVNGQLNLLLSFTLAIGLVAAEREMNPLAGIALALPATVKLFPATIGAYLLRRRQWSTAVVAVVTGVGLALLGLVVFGPDVTITYVTTVLPSEVQTGALARDPLDYGFLTVRRQLSALVPFVPTTWLPVVAVALVAPIVAMTYRRVESHLDQWFAAFATLVGTLLVLPLEGLYFPLILFPLVPLLYLTPAGRTRSLLFVGTVLTLLGITPATLDALAASGLFGEDLVAVIRSMAEPVFRVVLPGTVGMWLWLAAAVHWQYTGRIPSSSVVK